MNALVSGRAGVAILVDGERLLSLEVNREGPPILRAPRDVRFMLGDVRDIFLLEDLSIDEIRRHLTDARDADDALQLALFLLDAELLFKARVEAANALEEQLLRRNMVARFVEDVLYAHPMPKTADCMGALGCAWHAGAWRVLRLFDRLGGEHPAIAEVWRAWEALPPSLFADDGERRRVRATFVRAGVFRTLVRTLVDRGTIPSADEIAAAALSQDPQMRSVRDLDTIVDAWIAPIFAEPQRVGAPTEESGWPQALFLQLFALVGESVLRFMLCAGVRPVTLAEALVQRVLRTALETVFRSADHAPDYLTPNTWVFRIAWQHFKDWHRSQSDQNLIELDKSVINIFGSRNPEHEDDMETRLLSLIILEEPDPATRAMKYLSMIEGQSVSEISDALGIPVETVAGTLSLPGSTRIALDVEESSKLSNVS